mmetsp:Transcript_80370/g.111303  ORF Transcript_80370/g.111303 Transcript_80370/m.111303 type:complete len:103 (+) Transcript_80370:299-607(+)|eukprot:CAMPEP_0176356060 /NCGR_PEP_ID=MMETSP0126-20121128/13745_1 /TAXON_ID=141414 ORGANISM="Strombidinopsis acuminatum, Strain SPMC142" /NCGR_SAMPLE_ID=MMETSP0126 /ASSEMBLY_ACC=CAM_ASM_000229 /LENGTH=102 /DNA_ID=CAMNT_0017708989 /DNA_START=299 /DNA_END=607 /DNA_ORIENTATION=+
MYAQNFSKVGLLSNYKNEQQRMLQLKSRKDDNSSSLTEPLNYAGVQWKVNVCLSTNYVNKVLRPEVVLQIQTAENKKIRITFSVEKFEEMRRQVAFLLRYTQ